MLISRMRAHCKKIFIGFIISLIIFSSSYVFAQGNDMNLQKAKQEIQAKINQLTKSNHPLDYTHRLNVPIIKSLEKQKNGYSAVFEFDGRKQIVTFSEDELLGIEKGEFSKSTLEKIVNAIGPATGEPPPGARNE